MKGKILPTEKYPPDCPIGRLFCKGCPFRYEMAYDRDHVFCSHPDADGKKPDFDTDTGEGMTPGVEGFLVWVQRGDMLYHYLLKDHPAVGAAERKRPAVRKHLPRRLPGTKPRSAFGDLLANALNLKH